MFPERGADGAARLRREKALTLIALAIIGGAVLALPAAEDAE
jgi:hypothetical protein